VRKKARVRDTTHRDCRESEDDPNVFEVGMNWKENTKGRDKMRVSASK
jgi:hypothetical protein